MILMIGVWSNCCFLTVLLKISPFERNKSGTCSVQSLRHCAACGSLDSKPRVARTGTCTVPRRHVHPCGGSCGGIVCASRSSKNKQLDDKGWLVKIPF